MPEPVDEQNDVHTTRSQTISNGSEPYETAGTVADRMAAVPKFGPAKKSGEIGVLGPYRIIKQLGQGGMGAVYAAVDTRLDRKIALKVMLPAYAAIPTAKERFLREARAAAKVAHDHVVTVYEADIRDGIPYIAMQYLEGLPLDEYLKRKGEIAFTQILRIARETAAGLEAAHKLGLIHRDIKPGNLWLEAPHGRVKLLDFGLARPVDSDVELTKSGAILGTPAYMSPEQAQGERVDARSDLFSLGVMLYRLSSGQMPFQGNSTMAVLIALGSKDPAPLRSIKPEIPEDFARLVHDLLEKDPSRRPESAAEVLRRLRELGRNTSSTHQNSRPSNATQPLGSIPSSSTMPAYVPIPIGMASMANPFENIDVTDSMTVEPKTKANAEKKPPQKIPPIAIGSALVGFLMLLGVIVIIITNKDGTQTKIEVPEGSKVEVKDKGGKTLAKVNPNPVVDSNPDRKVAEWVITQGGRVAVNGKEYGATEAAALPAGPLTLAGVSLRNATGLTDADLDKLGDGGRLTWLNLDQTGLTDVALSRVKTYPRLTYLALNGTKVTDAGLALLADHPALEVVSLNGTAVTDAGLAQFRPSARLKGINLWNTKVTDAGLVHLAAAKELEHLNLAGTAVTDAGLAHLALHRQLIELRLDGTAVTDASLAQLQRCRFLTHLGVKGTKVTAKGLAEFHAAVPGCRIEHDGGVIEAVDVDRKAAEWVIARGGRVVLKGKAYGAGTSDLSLPAGPIELFDVDLRKVARLTDADLDNLGDGGRLGILYLDSPDITDAALARVKRFPRLWNLALNGTKVTDAGLALLADHPALEIVSLNGTAVTDAGLAQFRPSARLKGINLWNTKVTDAGLVHLAAAKELEHLNLAGTAVTDAGLAHLALHRQLIELRLDGTAVTDASLAQLQSCRFLTHLGVKGTKVTAKGLADFHNALPNCRIEHDGGVIEAVDVDRKAAESVLSNGGVVRVNGGKIDITAVAELPKEPFTVTFVNLAGRRGSDAALEPLKPLKGLTNLSVAGSKVSNSGLVHLKDIKSLTSLILSTSGVSDAGIEHLKQLDNLSVLDLQGIRLTDVGLEHLKSCRNLTRLNVRGTKVTAKGLADFHAAVPGCRIEHDGGVIEPKK